MDPLPPPTQPTTILHQQYQDSLESSSVSSPTTRQWDDTLPPPKLRMMCSYGGHIIPRPHDKSLCYMGGETRIVVADRHTSLQDLCSRLSTTLLHGRHFSLKYQLPSEDLDSLVSITTDEDLENMIEEYDRLNSSNPITNKPLRLRLFLFLTKPETAASMGSLLDDAKSETWFVDALNGAGLLPRGFSDTASIDNLLEHKDGVIQEGLDNNMIDYTDELEIHQRRPVDAQLNLPDPPLVETSSSFGSSSSSPSMSNLPPIKVRMVDHMNQMAGLDQQFSQLNVPVDEERSDHGAPSGGAGGGMRKPPLPLQPVQRKFAHDAYNLPSPDSSKHGLQSPDSITSDTSNVSASKPTFTQDPNPQSNRDTATPPMTTQFYPTTTTNYHIPIQQIPESSDAPPQQLNQDNHQHQQQHHHQHQQQQPPQQFYQTRPNYIQHPTTNQPPQPVQSYYQVYRPPQQMDHQQYPLYFLPVSQNHPYGMQLQSNQSDAVTTNPTTTASPLYPTKNAVPLSKPDMVTNSLYTTSNPGMIPVPSNQFQQYMNVSQIPHHPPTPMPTSNSGQYGYDQYTNPTQDQVYYTQHHSVAAPPPSQYQTMSPSSAMLLTQVSSAQQPAPESVKQ
uniref:leucine-rich repeat extensin-like protein 2 n=1 Tax=Erigeron canadensis TaxID=72917 RepID=UPI001CB954E7|nr:leucine-rich repeat extensin-like protein 2 [Erigeron canadensis]